MSDFQMNWIVNTFVPCDKTKDTITLGDIKPNENFVSSSIDFLEPTGPVKMIYDEDIGYEVEERYVYIADPTWTTAGVAGWYLSEDADNIGACYPKNGRVIKLGEGFCANNADGDDVNLTFSGVVYDQSVPLSLADYQMNWLGNCSPTQIKLGDITVTADFVSSSIDILEPTGPVKMIYDEDIGYEVEERYVYIADPTWTTAGVAGWYLSEDADNIGACYPKNDKVIEAGQGFCANNADGDGLVMTIPSAL